MRYREAYDIAWSIVQTLRPLCDRIDIAGSLRRQKAEVGDIEIVCIPSGKEILSFEVTVSALGIAKKGSAMGRYTQILLPDGINLDLFMARPDNWGYIFAIRTGSADYSHKVLATGWVKAGYRGEDGNLVVVASGEVVPVREEKDLFALIGVPWVAPWNREV